ncbi:MAG: phosphotransferase [Thermoanaerobaculia bacterium]
MLETPDERLRIDGARKRFGLTAGGEFGDAALTGDVGNRRYFRVASPTTASSRAPGALLVLYPAPHTEPQANWAVIGAALAGAGLRIPALLDDAPELGASLVEDLGDRDLASELASATPGEGRRLLDEAEELLMTLRSISHDVARRNAPFDADFFARELAHTRLWAFEGGGTQPLDGTQAAAWDAAARSLAEAAADPALTGDPVPTHRDFHGNNLMRASDGRLAPIDFQDLRMGPPDYDPVSLRFERSGERVPCDGSSYGEAVLLQRAWKVLGTFEKMLRAGREIYRPHRDAALRVLRTHTDAAGPFAELVSFLPATGVGV